MFKDTSTLVGITLLFAMLAMAFLTSCSSSLVTQTLNPDTNYRRDLKVTVNGKEFDGVGVPASSLEYQMTVRAPGDIDMITFTTCHREVAVELMDPVKGEDKASAFWIYKPVKGVEDRPGCGLEISTRDKTKGKHASAFLDFFHPEETLTTEIYCDGKKRVTGGVQVCQARAGLLQKVIFPEPVKVSPDEERCNVFKTTDQKTFEFVMPTGECSFEFGTRDKKRHWLTIYGYESILIRGN